MHDTTHILTEITGLNQNTSRRHIKTKTIKRFASTLHLRRMRLRGAFGLSRSSLRAFFQRLVTCAPNVMLVATQAFAPTERRDAASRRPPRGGGGPAASAAAASRHSRSARRLVPRGAGGDQGASVFALCRVLVPRTRHAGARRRSSIHLSSSDICRRRATASGPYSSQPTIPPS